MAVSTILSFALPAVDFGIESGSAWATDVAAGDGTNKWVFRRGDAMGENIVKPAIRVTGSRLDHAEPETVTA